MSAAAAPDRARSAPHQSPREDDEDRRNEGKSSRKLWKRLENPLALVVQGFLAGGILFFTLHPFAEPAPVMSDPSRSTLLNVQV